MKAQTTRAVVAGVVSGAAALGAAELVAAFVRPVSSPVVAVGSVAVDATPEWLKHFAIRSFGQHDKTVLLSVVALAVVALCAVAGIVAQRRPQAGVAVVALLAVAAGAAAVSRPDSALVDVLPSLAALGVGAMLLPHLARRSRQASRHVTGEPSWDDFVEAPATSRRRFVLLAGATAGLAVATGGLGRLIGSHRRDVTASRASVQLPRAVSPAPAPPAQLQVDGLTPFLTREADFYRIDTALVVPRVAAETWRLRIHGEVDNAFELTFAQLSARPLMERDVTLTCVSNEVGGPLAGNARWLGASLADVLREARPRAGADMVLSTSADGFTVSTPLAAILDGRDAMLAIAMNGSPLPVRHGFPVRMVIPGLYGYVSATKWVVDLEVLRFGDEQAYWTERGWAEQAPIKTAARIDVPASSSQVSAGKVMVAGVAWAQHRGIGAVDVRIDGGPWLPARLAGVPSVDTWRQWVVEWDAVPGDHTIECRATDGTGAVQTGERHGTVPDGATGWHSTVVTVK